MAAPQVYFSDFFTCISEIKKVKVLEENGQIMEAFKSLVIAPKSSSYLSWSDGTLVQEVIDFINPGEPDITVKFVAQFEDGSRELTYPSGGYNKLSLKEMVDCLNNLNKVVTEVKNPYICSFYVDKSVFTNANTFPSITAPLASDLKVNAEHLELICRVYRKLFGRALATITPPCEITPDGYTKRRRGMKHDRNEVSRVIETLKNSEVKKEVIVGARSG